MLKYTPNQEDHHIAVYQKNNDLIWWGEESDLEKRVAIMQIAEAFFLPSLVEGLSLSLLEAMSTGTACIASDAGADGEVLENGAGIVISTDNVTTQLKTIIPILIDNPNLLKTLGEKGRKRILEKYSIEKKDCQRDEIRGPYFQHQSNWFSSIPLANHRP